LQPRPLWFHYYRRGLAYEAQDDHAQAAEDFKKAYGLEPTNPQLQAKMKALAPPP
ncbi:MAG: tetratricopeptide repeat protein, partial [Proteobacteria bacterium]|nr:tetratricopeptide repeat protein [Pseudomonadota bacterium]